ncbi:hypothetical protein Hanom_Chr09g00840531 [Helianthus anomalus]
MILVIDIDSIEISLLNGVNYIVSPCGLYKVTYLGTNSLESHSRVLTFHFVAFEGIKDIFRLKITFC